MHGGLGACLGPVHRGRLGGCLGIAQVFGGMFGGIRGVFGGCLRSGRRGCLEGCLQVDYEVLG